MNFQAELKTSREMLPEQLKGGRLLALPQSAEAVLRLSKDPENGPPEFAIPISADVGLTTQILKFANSSFFGFKHKISTVQMALSLICVRTILNFVLWKAVFSFLPKPRSGPFDLNLLSQDALRRACFAKAIASYIKDIDSEELFVIALLQDIAIPILADIWPVQYEHIFAEHKRCAIPISVLEKTTFDWDHAYAGSILVRAWGFDEHLAAMVGAHNEKYNFRAENVPLENVIIRLSSFLPSVQDEHWKDADDFFALFQKVRFQGKIANLPGVEAIFHATEEMATKFKDFVNVEYNGSSLVDLYQKYLEDMRIPAPVTVRFAG